jgi:hypothetical protein
MTKKDATGAAARRHRPSPAGSVTQVSLADLVAAYYSDSKPTRGKIASFRIDALKGGDPFLGEVLLATLAAASPPMLLTGEDGKLRVIRNADTVFALASFTPGESWAATRVRCHILSESFFPGSSYEELTAIFEYLGGSKSVNRKARKGMRHMRLIRRDQSCDVARSASVLGRRR